MGLYERLLEERVEEEQRRGKPLPVRRGLYSEALSRRFKGVSERKPGYTANLSMMHRLITRGPRSVREGMRLRSLKAKYRDEYGKLRAEERGQGELW
jgi:hypothetical protein